MSLVTAMSALRCGPLSEVEVPDGQTGQFHRNLPLLASKVCPFAYTFPFATTGSVVAHGDVGDVDVAQPLMWTFIEFEADDGEAERLADALERVLDPASGWYCDFRTDAETFVVFADRTFRYRRGDERGRAEAEGYARSVGVPEAQLDWPT